MTCHRHSVRWVGFAVLIGAAAIASAQQKSSAMLAVAIRPDKAPPSIMFLDPVSGKLLGRVPAGPDPHNMEASADGRFLFVANVNSHDTGALDGDSLSVIDVAAMKELRRVPTGENSHPHDVRFVNGRVYFTAQGWQAVGMYNPERNKIEWMLGLGQDGPHHLAVTRDGRHIFATNGGSNSISAATLRSSGDPANQGKSTVPPAPNWEVTTLPGGEDAEAVDVTPDGREAWSSDKEKAGGRLTIVDVATKKIKQVVPMHTKHANRLRISPDGKHALLLDRETQELFIIEIASRQLAKRMKFPGDTSRGLSVYDLAISADSSNAYITVSAGAIETRYDAEGRNIRASAGDRSVVGNRAWLAVIDLKTLTEVKRLPIDAGADTVAWVPAR
jgi:DNA-binding beta-propeller fold protein YncE